MRCILSGMLAGTVFVLLTGVVMATDATGGEPEDRQLKCEDTADGCIYKLSRPRLDEVIDKAYQLGYRKGYGDGFSAARPSSLSTRWAVPDDKNALGVRIIQTGRGEIPDIKNAYPLPPGLWE